MPRDKKGEVDTRRPSRNIGEPHTSYGEDYDESFDHNNAATPRGHQDGGLDDSMAQANLSTLGHDDNYTYATYNEQNLRQEPQFYASPQDPYQSGQFEYWNEQTPQPTSSTQLYNSSRSATSRTQSSRHHSSRHNGQHGQHGQHGHERYPVSRSLNPAAGLGYANVLNMRTGDPATDKEETAFGAMAERQMVNGSVNSDGAFGEEQWPVIAHSGVISELSGFDTPRPGGNFGGRRGFINEDLYSNHGYQKRDLGYAEQHSTEFRVGRVLKMLWPEPLGVNTTRSTAASSFYSTSKGDVFTKERRFIIVETYSGHSVAVPITTYGDRACTKPGVHPEHHGIVYSEGKQPTLLQNEKVGFPPVAMFAALGDNLLPTSRVNYRKCYTVEHNVRIQFVGEIIPEHLSIIYNARNSVPSSEQRGAAQHGPSFHNAQYAYNTQYNSQWQNGPGWAPS